MQTSDLFAAVRSAVAAAETLHLKAKAGVRAIVKDAKDLVALLVQRGSSRIFVPVELA